MSCYPSAPQTEQGWGGWTLTFKLGSKRLFRLLDVATYIDGLCAIDPSNPINRRRKRGRPTKVQQQAMMLSGTPLAGPAHNTINQG